MPLRILHLEDDANDAELIAIELASKKGQWPFDLLLTPTEAEFSKALDNDRFDVILSDSSGPSFNGEAALALARRKQPKAIFIFVSGYKEETPNGATKDADGFVLKHQLSELLPAIQQALNLKK